MDHQDSVDELRRRLGAELDQSYDWDFNLHRWLNAYEFDVDVVAPLLIDTLHLRRTLKLDKVTTDDSFRDKFNKCMMEQYPGGLCGYDKHGNVLYIEPTGNCDPRTLLTAARCSEFIRWRLFETEHVLALIRKQEQATGKKCHLTMIMDLEGLTMDQIYMPAMHVYTGIVSLVQRHYPDMLSRLLIIKAPAVVNVAYRIILPFLSKHTRNKLEFVNGELWRAKLGEWVDDANLPIKWGGSYKGLFGDYGDVRPGGRLAPPPDVDSALTLRRTPPQEAKSLVVARGSISRIRYKVDEQSCLSWFVSCSLGDVEFGVDRIHAADRRVVSLVPRFRLNTEAVPEFGAVEEVAVGDYEIVFDNSYSWIRSKTILYHVDIKPSSIK